VPNSSAVGGLYLLNSPTKSLSLDPVEMEIAFTVKITLTPTPICFQDINVKRHKHYL